MFSSNGPIMILHGHHLSHNQDVWLLQIPGADDSKGGSNGSKDLDMHPARPPKSDPFSAVLCVRAGESPRRSAGLWFSHPAGHWRLLPSPSKPWHDGKWEVEKHSQNIHS